MTRVVTLNTTGYEPFLDFLKAYAIICVIMGHTITCLDKTGYFLWYGMQVPMFVLIQVFHTFKKDKPKINFSRCCQRVIVSYILVQTVIILIYALLHGANSLSLNLVFKWGCGPGFYYPWIYVQLAILLPLLRPLFNKGTKIQQGIVAVIICEVFEISSSLVGLPDYVHRLLAIRYFFMIYLGWLWVKDGIVINKWTVLLSLLSMCAIVYFEYFYKPTTPWFYDTAWRTHRWPCYFYVSHLLCYMLYMLYSKIGKYIDKLIKMLARCSYEIFLMQMAVIFLFPQLAFIKNTSLRLGTRIILIFAVSITLGYYFNKIRNMLLQKTKTR